MDTVTVCFLMMCVLLSSALDHMTAAESNATPVTLVILASNEAHILPHYLGAIDRLTYPKEKITLWIRSDHNDDLTTQILEEWVQNVSHLYSKINYKLEPGYPTYESRGSEEHWMHKANLRQKALEFASHHKTRHTLFIDCSVLITEDNLIQKLQDEIRKTGALVAAPYIEIYNKRFANFWIIRTEAGYFEHDELQTEIVEWAVIGCYDAAMVKKVFMVDNQHEKFDEVDFLFNLTRWRNHAPDTLPFSQSVLSSNSRLVVCNKARYGETIFDEHHHNHGTQAKDLYAILRRRALFNKPLKPSQFVTTRPWGQKSLGNHFDMIYIINLKRRPQRKTFMEQVMWEVGVDNYKFFDAVDGRMLNQSYLDSMNVRMMDGFVEPVTGRDYLTNGEIGCFLSHYLIWVDAVNHGYSSILIFEDDAAIDLDVWTGNYDKIMEEFEAMKDDWDLLYLGRKVLDKSVEENIGQYTYIHKPSYSYWCVAYAMSNRGLQKLLDQKPLTKMIPTDEFIPIMYDQHPREDWKSNFGPRDLQAYTTKPLLFWPSHYPHEVNYVSDTEERESQVEIDTVVVENGVVIKDEL